MIATRPQTENPAAAGPRAPKERPSEARGHAPARPRPQMQQQPGQPPRWHEDTPAAGAHAARHLINEDATPGAGALPSHAHRSGKEVDGGAG